MRMYFLRHGFHGLHGFFLASCLAIALSANAQKEVTNSQMIGFGPTNVLDTYLSAEHFNGVGLTYLSHTERKKIKNPCKSVKSVPITNVSALSSTNSVPSRITTVLQHEANLSSVKDRAGNKSELEGAYNFYWGKLYAWNLFDRRLTLQAGGMVNATLGFIYNTANGNNPAQARAALNIMPTGVATYRFQLGRIPLTARYELALPLCGIRFSPNYGQSYYEIFSRGNYDHNAVPTTFISAPEWRQLLTVDARLSPRITLRLGYLGNMQQHHVNNIRQHVYTHRVLLGFTRTFSVTRL